MILFVLDIDDEVCWAPPLMSYKGLIDLGLSPGTSSTQENRMDSYTGYYHRYIVERDVRALGRKIQPTDQCPFASEADACKRFKCL